MDKKVMKEKRAASRKLFHFLFSADVSTKNKVKRRRKKKRKSVNISRSHVKENYVKS